MRVGDGSLVVEIDDADVDPLQGLPAINLARALAGRPATTTEALAALLGSPAPAHAAAR